MLKVDDVHVSYGAISALHGLTLNAADGEMIAVVGANGAGKSTLLKAIAGFLHPSHGDITLDSTRLNGIGAEKRVRHGVALVPEGRQIWTELTVEDHLRLGAAAKPGQRKHLKTRLDEVYELFPRLKERKKQLGGTLSGGEQQMLAIGRALIAQPRVLLLDEPTLGLAPVVCQAIAASLTQTRTNDRIVICAEQNVDFALNLADRAYVLEIGEIKLQGTTTELNNNPQLIGAYLGTTTTPTPTPA